MVEQLHGKEQAVGSSPTIGSEIECLTSLRYSPYPRISVVSEAKQKSHKRCTAPYLDELENEGKLAQHGTIGQSVFYTPKGE